MTRRIKGVAVVSVAALAVAITGGTALAGGSGGPRLRAELAGTNELPPTDPDGEGRARVKLHIDEGKVCFAVRFRDAGTPNRGHIHVGDAATNGGIVVPLFELVADATDPRHDALESDRALEGCVTADPALLEQIAADPDGYYVNLHNARFPGGVMRGQLED
jgi:hypothetical protein